MPGDEEEEGVTLAELTKPERQMPRPTWLCVSLTVTLGVTLSVLVYLGPAH
jgi:hypothetical protein